MYFTLYLLISYLIYFITFTSLSLSPTIMNCSSTAGNSLHSYNLLSVNTYESISFLLIQLYVHSFTTTLTSPMDHPPTNPPTPPTHHCTGVHTRTGTVLNKNQCTPTRVAVVLCGFLGNLPTVPILLFFLKFEPTHSNPTTPFVNCLENETQETTPSGKHGSIPEIHPCRSNHPRSNQILPTQYQNFQETSEHHCSPFLPVMVLTKPPMLLYTDNVVDLSFVGK